MEILENNFTELLDEYGREVHEKLIELSESLIEDMIWPYEKGRPNQLQQHQVYYYNAAGEKFNVEYEFF